MMQTTGRLLKMEANRAAMNMAVDEAMLLSQKEQPNPTLRFYTWSSAAFSFGYFQDIASEVDVEACRADDIELVKRMTGGGTVVHGWDLTYTLILPRHTGEKSISEVYQRLGEGLVKAFETLGIPAECHAVDTDVSQTSQNICLTNPADYDVMCQGKKLAGVSVRRNRNGMMFQGYISLYMPPVSILRRVSRDCEVQQILIEKSTAINTDGRSITKSVLIKAISETFNIGIAFYSGKLSSVERAQAETLAETKYTTATWNF
ncbi:lipoate--protein ligase family protein [Candidatus Poribacteria bacterium]|nr:biotin/lipoate A/B protein ligase family protein [Candidatus Poribacteria bacterium]MXY28435.1 lipoate--protein ligase family protein [Candidatus Poribacteria bacterium]MYK19084.1 lipoate--protein ligase family protein [Candidatus Poribacteria bacterium]